MTESGNRVAQRFADGDGKHQRRLTNRLAPEDDALLPGVAEETDTEVLRHLGPRRQFVSGRARSGEAAVLVPQQLLERQPSHSLYESPFNLAAIDDWRKRLADVLQDVDAADAVVAREAVDFHLAHRRAECEVVKRLAASGSAIEMNVGSPVKPVREQRNTLHVSGFAQFLERELPANAGGHRIEALFQLPAGVHHRGAAQIDR